MILGLNPFVWKISLLIPLIILFGCEQYIYQDSGSTSRLTAKNDIKFTKSEKNGDDSTYLVQQDDNLYSISRNLKIPLNLLIKANNLHPPYLLRTGQKLQVPRGSFYTVKKGDTLFRIAKNNDISVYELCKINSIKSANKIYFGQKLQLPLPVQRQEQIAQNNKKQLIKNSKILINNNNLYNKSNVISKNKFLWPVRGRVISRFGKKESGIHEDGIKIATRLGEGVHASRTGKVIYSGSGLKGFGNLIIIKHKNDWISAYGHNQVNLVRTGTVVTEGEVIAKAGKSGNVKAPQLYFQLRKGFDTVDPQKFLL